MDCVTPNYVKALLPLQSAHYTFPRAAVLREAFTYCVMDYYVKALTGKEFEARGLLVTRKSRVGKIAETLKIVNEFNASKTEMPNGKTAKILYCKLDGSVSWKDLGRKTLEKLEYSVHPRRTQSEIWSMVRHQSREQGVIGFYYDECQHVFAPEAKSNRIFLDSFKSLMKEPEWPLIMILSGVPDLAEYVNSEEQLSHLLAPVHFDEISLGKSADPLEDPDLNELNKLVYSYAAHGGIDVDELVDLDFLERLDFACVSRWGLVIELLIRAFAMCRFRGGERGHY